MLTSPPYAVAAVRREPRIVALFAATTFVASAMLFVVQPLFAKMVLPRLGGSPSVWNTCVLFFQAALLLGYLYAHLSIRWLGPRRQAIVHVAVLCAPILVLPLRLSHEGPAPGEDPTWWLLKVLTVQVGPPFLVLATMAPLLQRWFATLHLPSARDPYFLYAASNTGSLLALLAFPFLLEPALGVTAIARTWFAGYFVLLMLAAGCALTAARSPSSVPDSGAALPLPIAARLRLWWLFLAFIPSSLMLGVTTHISTDLAAVPLLWIVPLCIYLLTFVVAFSLRQPFPPAAAGPLSLLIIAALASMLLQAVSPYLILLHLAAFSVGALACHGELARSRPAPGNLTEFYLWLSAGGVLGGVANTLIAPNVFTGIYEYPLMLALAYAVALGRSAGKPEPWAFFAISAAIPIAAVLFTGAGDMAGAGLLAGRKTMVGALMLASFWTFTRRRTPARILIGVTAIMIVSRSWGLPGTVLFADRSFFGVVKVVASAETGHHVLQHGTTLHGSQDVRDPSSCNPLAYYHRNGPVGQLFRALGAQFRHVAVVGLGTGAIACYAQTGQRMTFFEIDPIVRVVAEDPRLFTYLKNRRGLVDVQIGDGRTKLEQAPTASYDLIIVDAFSSDSIPVHLVTGEALELYSSRLRDGGVIGFHISNRYLNLEDVLGATAASVGLTGIVNRDIDVPEVPENAGRTPSHWVLLSKGVAPLRSMSNEGNWLKLNLDGRMAAWTDDYSNILDALLSKRAIGGGGSP